MCTKSLEWKPVVIKELPQPHLSYETNDPTLAVLYPLLREQLSKMDLWRDVLKPTEEWELRHEMRPILRPDRVRCPRHQTCDRVDVHRAELKSEATDSCGGPYGY